MPMTRHPARSFTFEIKRANRRMPEVVTLSKTSSPESPSLADQVFGKFSVQPRTPRADAINVPASVRPALSLGTNSPEVLGTTEPSAKRSTRRVLPDLLSAPVNPVEERVRLEADERAARRRAARVSRARKVVERSSVAATREETAPTLVAATPSAVTKPVSADEQWREAVATSSQPIDPPVEPLATSRKWKRNAPLAVFRRAERNGRSPPHLLRASVGSAVCPKPAGEVRKKKHLLQVA
jgi:hypothetical protein